MGIYYIRRWHVPFPYSLLEGRYGEQTDRILGSAHIERVGLLLERAEWPSKTNFQPLILSGILRPEAEKGLDPQIFWVVTKFGLMSKFREDDKPETIEVRVGTVFIGRSSDRYNLGLRMCKDPARPCRKRRS